jgi:tetratricopeptide (TPR) repeat protein
MLHNISGAAHQSLGQLDAAINSFTNATIIKPDYAEGYNNLGIVLQAQGKIEKAIEAYQKALAIKPDHANSYFNMGISLKDRGRLEEAIGAYKKALAIKPDYVDAYYNMGNILQEQGKLEEAIEAYNKALAIKPDLAAAHYNMGKVLQEQGKLEEAIKAFKSVIEIKPNYSEAFNNIGLALQEQGYMEDAIEFYTKAITLKQDYAEAYYNMGNIFRNLGRLKEAIQAYHKALAIKPEYVEAYNNIGITLKDQGRNKGAIEAYENALKIKPNYAETHFNMGNVCRDQGELEEAIEAYQKAVAIIPDYAEAHLNLSFAFLNSGRLKEGLDEYEWRWTTAKFSSENRYFPNRYFSRPLWDGKQSLRNKRILAWCEQGIGDTINWSSCLPFLASQAENCILECQEKLVPLLTRSFPNIEVKPENRSLDSERDDFDFHIPMGSLYRHFIPEISQNSNAKAFLVPDTIRVNFWKERLKSIGNPPYIGISWKSSNMSSARLPNYAPISEWTNVLTLAEVTLINLQAKDFANDLSKIQNELGVRVHNFDDLDHYDNLDDVAALSAALDVVISIKSALPLITAGVGTSTKLANWRQSAWNNILFNPVGSSVDIFERNTWEPWGNVFRLIAEDTLKLTKDWSS